MFDYEETALEGRLDHLLRGWGAATRPEIRVLLAEGRITVNGLPAAGAFQQCTADDAVEIDGMPVERRPFLTVMLNKPSGTACVLDDARHPSVTTLLRGEGSEHTLMPVGRLDAETEGLVILTNDGHLSARITHPDRAVIKTYLAEFDLPLSPDAAEQMAAGITLPNGVVYRPAGLELLDEHHARVTVTEGKYHEVRRLIRACGSKVLRLTRLSIGCLELGDLPSGGYRALSKEEIGLLFRQPEKGANAL